MPEFQRILAIAFLDLYDRKAAVPVTPLNSVAQEDLDELQVLAGRMPAPAPPMTFAQQLENQVLDDWKNLSGDQIRELMRTSRDYREMVNKLADQGKLK